MAGVSAGRLNIEIVAEVARLQQDMDRVKRLVGAASSDIAKNARAANDNLSNIGKGAGANIVQFSRDVAQLKAQVDPAWASLQKYKDQVYLLGRALREGAIDQDQYTREIIEARAAWQSGGQAMVRSTNAQRMGFQQLSMQLGDVTTMYAMGARPMQIFASQSGQIIQSIQLMSLGAGKFATFMSNPWVAAITAATMILVPLISTLGDAEKATEEVTLVSSGLSDAQNTLGEMYDLVTGKIINNSAALRANNVLMALNLRIKAMDAKAAEAAAFAKVKPEQGPSDWMTADLVAYGSFEPTQVEKNVKKLTDMMSDLKAGAITYEEAISKISKSTDAAFKGTGISRRDFMEGLSQGYSASLQNQTAESVELTNATGKLDESLRKAADANKQHREKMTDAEKAYKAAFDAAENYIDGLELEIAKIGLSDQALRQLEVQRAKDAAATDAQRSEIEKLNRAREASLALDAAKKFSGSLADETANMGLSADQIKENEAVTASTAAATAAIKASLDAQKAAAEGASIEVVQSLQNSSAALTAESVKIMENLDKWKARKAELAQQEIDKRIGDLEFENSLIGTTISQEMLLRGERDATVLGIQRGTDAWNRYIAAVQVAIDEQERIANSEAMLDMLDGIADRATRAAQAMESAFGKVGGVIGDLNAEFAKYAADKAKAEDKMAKAEKDYGKKSLQYLNAQNDAKALQIDHYRNLAGTAKTFFKEGSTGYKVMEAAEKAFALVQLANTATNVAAGAAKMFAELGPWAFPVVAAMVAVMAGLGFSGGGGASRAPTSAEDVQAAQGAGTVLGDPTGKSESIANSLELVADNTNEMLEYQNPILRVLRSIDDHIGALATQVAQELSIGGAFDTTGKVGTSSSSGILGIFGSSTTKTLYDQGLQFASTSLSNAIANGISGSTYQIIEKVKKSNGFFGIGGGTKTTYTTTTGALDPDLQRQVGLILGSLRDSVVEAAKVLGMDVQAALDTFQVEIGKISFKDMGPDEIADALEAVFSKVGDQMAGFAVQGLEQFQQAGEGLFETLMRLAKDYTTIDVSLKSIGKTFGAVGAASMEARESLIALFGTLDDFVEATAYYQQNFLTDAEQIAPIQAQVQSTLASLGLSNVDTIAEFKHVVDGIDLTTEAGQQLYASMMALAPAFYEVEQYQEKAAQDAQEAAQAAAAKAADLAKQRAQLDIQILQAQGKAAEALEKQRAAELAAADESLRSKMRELYKAQDIATARDDLSKAYERESSAIQQTRDKLKGLGDTLRDFRSTLFDTTGSADSYVQRLAKFQSVSGLARFGDQDAMAKLPEAGRDLIEAARNRASSAADVQRVIAMVAQATDQAISAADQGVSEAEEQLAQMKAQVEALGVISQNVLSVEEAIERLTAIMGPQTSAEVNTPVSSADEAREERADRRQRRLEDLVSRLRDETGRLSERFGEMNQRWRRLEQDGALRTVAVDEEEEA